MSTRSRRCQVGLAVAVVALACSRKRHDDPLLNVGSFSVPVPYEWHNVTAGLEPGELALEVLRVGEWKDKQPITMILSPLPEPIAKDPSDLALCKEHAASLTLTVMSATIVDLPAGKACAVEARRRETHVSQIILRVGTHGVMANCTYNGDERAMCDAIFQRIALAGGRGS